MNLFLACDKKIDNPDTGLNDELNFSQSDYESILKNTILNTDSTNITGKSFKDNLDTLKYFYSTKDYKPIFIKSFESKNVVDSLLDIFGNSYQHGLNPELYHYTANQKRIL